MLERRLQAPQILLYERGLQARLTLCSKLLNTLSPCNVKTVIEEPGIGFANSITKQIIDPPISFRNTSIYASMWPLIRSLLFQSPCPLCQRPAKDQFCRDCTAQILNQRFSENVKQWQGKLPHFVWGEYEGQLRRALQVMKFERQPDIGLWLGQELGEQWLKQPRVKLPFRPNVVPIPLHPRKQAQRGFNQAERIAWGFCRLTGYPLRPQALQRSKDTKALFDLSPGDRQRELQSALTVGPEFNTRQPWLIVDDIVTTGSTALEAQRAMEQKGAKVIGLVAIAAPAFFRPGEPG